RDGHVTGVQTCALPISIDREIAAGLRAEGLAGKLPRLEEDERTLITQAANLRARVERDEEIVAQAKGGLCPLLAERCLNMKGGQIGRASCREREECEVV